MDGIVVFALYWFAEEMPADTFQEKHLIDTFALLISAYSLFLLTASIFSLLVSTVKNWNHMK